MPDDVLKDSVLAVLDEEISKLEAHQTTLEEVDAAYLAELQAIRERLSKYEPQDKLFANTSWYSRVVLEIIGARTSTSALTLSAAHKKNIAEYDPDNNLGKVLRLSLNIKLWRTLNQCLIRLTYGHEKQEDSHRKAVNQSCFLAVADIYFEKQANSFFETLQSRAGRSNTPWFLSGGAGSLLLGAAIGFCVGVGTGVAWGVGAGLAVAAVIAGITLFICKLTRGQTDFTLANAPTSLVEKWQATKNKLEEDAITKVTTKNAKKSITAQAHRFFPGTDPQLRSLTVTQAQLGLQSSGP